MKNIRPHFVADFWDRLLAYAIDVVVMWLVSFAVFIISSWLKISFDYVYWFNTAFVFLYFMLLESYLNKGQTIGKRALGLAVVDKNGEPLSLGKAFVRTFFRSVGFTGINILSLLTNNRAIMFTEGLVINIVEIGTILFILFHPLRRGIHDLLAGSFLVDKDNFNKLSLEEKKKALAKEYPIRKLLITSIILGLLLGLSTYYLVGSAASVIGS